MSILSLRVLIFTIPYFTSFEYTRRSKSIFDIFSCSCVTDSNHRIADFNCVKQ